MKLDMITSDFFDSEDSMYVDKSMLVHLGRGINYADIKPLALRSAVEEIAKLQSESIKAQHNELGCSE